jgi:predicted DNA-binding antitoxin AbrB/MazE fold protein
MAHVIEAVYEHGTFKPLGPVELQEGQRVTLSVEPLALTAAEAEAQLCAWQRVYEGLSEDDVDEVEAIALDRSSFFRSRDDGDGIV